MTREELIVAIDSNKEVRWQNDNYKLYKSDITNQYLVTSQFNDYTFGIFHRVGDGMNVDPNDCYIKNGEKDEK